MVKAQDIIKQALALDPSRRFEVVEEILHSLDQPDPAIDAIWQQEAERRLAARWKLERVRVESSKNRFTTVRPRRAGSFLTEREDTAAIWSAVSRMRTASR